jgi:hypothetical protein
VRRPTERRTPVISSLASLRHTNYSPGKVRSAHRVLSIRDRASRPSSDPSFLLPFFPNPSFPPVLEFRRSARHRFERFHDPVICPRSVAELQRLDARNRCGAAQAVAPRDHRGYDCFRRRRHGGSDGNDGIIIGGDGIYE